MSTNFPSSLDSLTNPVSTDKVSVVDHAAQHANANDAIEAIEAKVGVNGSAVTTSHDYKLSEVTSTDKAVGKTATQTLTNKTLTAPVISTISNTGTLTLPTSTDTLVGRATTDTLTNKTLGATGMTGDLDLNNNDITEIKTATFNGEYDNGNSGTSKTIDWNNGQKQKITTTGSCVLTFTAPAGPCNLLLRIVHEASATAYTYTWPASVKFPGNTDPATTNTSGAVDIVSLYFDGTSYFGVASLNFS